MSALKEVAPDRLRVTERPLRFYGVEVGNRTTACRLSGAGLRLHSPVRLTEESCGRTLTGGSAQLARHGKGN